MRRLSTFHILALLFVIGSTLMAGCSGAKAAITAPEVPGEQLTNPNPGDGVPGSYIPYIPPPPSGDPSNDPIPAFTDPGMSNQNGQNTNPEDLDPVYDPSEDGMDLILTVETGGSGGFLVEAGSSDGKTTLFSSQDGGAIPIFDPTTTGPIFNSSTGQLTIPLQPNGDGLDVWITVTILDGQGGLTNDSHTITLPPGWTPVDQYQSGGAQMF